MRGRLVPLLAAVVLSVPPARFVTLHFERRDVTFQSAEWRARVDVLARARVFVPAPPDIRSLDLSTTAGESGFDLDDDLRCTYVPKPTSATSSKFDCRLGDGRVIKVKYGRTREKNGEVAATRLLAALGFGADHVSIVRRVRCDGCPPLPFQTRRIAEWFLVAPLVDAAASYSGSREFDWPAVERKLDARSIEVPNYEGWDWWELKEVDAHRGGASRAELDALRLMAVFLAHWDNKATNQRLACVAQRPGEENTEACDFPLLVVQDVGSTFGPGKVVHEHWDAAPIWIDPGACVTGMETLPYQGGGFEPTRISEEGRRLLAGKLGQITRTQIEQLVRGARFPDPETGEADGDVTPWIRTFEEKVRQIADRPPCPSLPK